MIPFAALFLCFLVGGICGIVAFYQWALTKRLRAHRKVLDFMAGALRIQDRATRGLEDRAGRLEEDRLSHLARIAVLETALSITAPEDRARPPSDRLASRSLAIAESEMGERNIEMASTAWKRLMDEDD